MSAFDINEFISSGRKAVMCDSIMAFVVNHGKGAKFGINGVVNSFEHKATQEEVVAALDYLLNKKFLKYVGQYAFGLGVGTDIQPYSFIDFAKDAYFPKPSGEELLVYQQLFIADTGKPPKKERKPRKPKAEKQLEQPAKQSIAKSADIPSFTGEASKVIRKGGAFIEVPNSERVPDVFAEIDQLSRKLQSADIKDRELKCSVLMRLSKVMGPGISKVLSDIHADYEGKSL